VILWDYTDKEYNSVLLGRDEYKQICAINVMCSFSDIISVEEWLKVESDKIEASGQTYFFQWKFC